METLETIIANNPELRQILPMPLDFYKKYNIPPPKVMSFQEALYSAKFSNGEGTEIKDIAPGGVREMPQSEPLEITLKAEENQMSSPEGEA